jgi:chorismate synthase
MIARIDEARSNGDTVGGVFEVVAHGLPIGWGRTSSGIADSTPRSPAP